MDEAEVNKHLRFLMSALFDAIEKQALQIAAHEAVLAVHRPNLQERVDEFHTNLNTSPLHEHYKALRIQAIHAVEVSDLHALAKLCAALLSKPTQ